MIGALKAEFRKLLTIRSTYVILLVALAFTFLIAFYALGYVGAQSLQANSEAYATSVRTVIQFVGLIIGLISILLVSHEYRYLTIMHTLTIARWRWQPMLAKFIAITVFVVITTVVITLLAPLLTRMGMAAHHVTPVAQNLPYAELLTNSVLYAWGTAMFGAIIAFLVRSQVGAITIYLLLPLVVENILMLFLKDNTKYLPFTALSNLIQGGPTQAQVSSSVLSYSSSLLLTIGYIIGGGIVAYILFAKRDAN